LKKFPKLRKYTKGKLWTRSYFISAAGNVSSEIIKKNLNRTKKNKHRIYKIELK
jgi:REP element-mobilizing transposase RayT